MNCDYFNLLYRLGGNNAFLLWYSGETDGIVLDLDGKAPSFCSTQDSEQFALNNGLSIIAEEPILHDLDAVAEWLKHKNTNKIDCNNLLAAWNLFADISRSCDGSFDSNLKLTNKIYEKLFWGSNIPAVTPVGKSYYPMWTRGELKIMRKIIRSGLSLFRKVVKPFVLLETEKC